MRLLPEVRNLMGNYHLKSGIYHFYRDEYKQAVGFFLKALSDEPSLSDGDLRTAREYLTQTFVHSAERMASRGELEGAARDFERALEVSPDFPDIRFRLGQVLEGLDRAEDAVREYRRAVEASDAYEAAHTALAFCLLRFGRHAEAAEAFAAVFDLRVRRLREPYEKGLQRLREGMASEAEEFFHEAFLASPMRFEEQYREGLAQLKAGEFEKSLAAFEEAIAIFPKFEDLHNYRGVTLCELGRVEDAILAFRRSISLAPDYLAAKVNLAFAHLRSGQFKEAEAQLESVLEQDPTQSAAQTKLAELKTGRAADSRRATPRGGAR